MWMGGSYVVAWILRLLSLVHLKTPTHKKASPIEKWRSSLTLERANYFAEIILLNLIAVIVQRWA